MQQHVTKNGHSYTLIVTDRVASVDGSDELENFRADACYDVYLMSELLSLKSADVT